MSETIVHSYKGRMITHATTVFAYRNLHRAMWSLRAEDGPHKGKVVGHTTDVRLLDARLKVSEAGRQRVLAEGKKNVHAGVVGKVAPEGFAPEDFRSTLLSRKLNYNPYKAPTFTVDGLPVTEATLVHLAEDGKAYAYGNVA